MSSVRARPREQSIARILEYADKPQHTSEAPALVLMMGLPGSGKSTFARRLARETGAVVLESDALRVLLFEGPAYDQRENRELFAALHEAARRLLENGSSVIIDATNLKPSDRRPAHEIAASTGAHLQLVHVWAPEQVIEARLARRADSREPEDNSTADIGVYRRMSETELPLRKEHLSIDMSDPAAIESAFRVVVERVRKWGAMMTGGRTS